MDFYCCADCEYHFVDGGPKKQNPNQYLDCDHLHKEIVNGRLVCLRCGYEGEKEGIRYSVPLSNKCVHKRFEKNYNIVFCVNCGVEGPITFPPVWYWETGNNQYIPRISYYNDKYNKSSKPNDGEDDGEDGGVVKCKPNTRQPPRKPCLPREPNGDLTEYTSIWELREEAVNRGIKDLTTMSKKKLCKALGIEITGKGTYFLKNISTRDIQDFKNIQEISHKFKITKWLVHAYMNKEIIIDDKTYFLKKQQ